MMKKITLFLAGVAFTGLVGAQGKASVTFSSAKSITVEVYKPIDKAFQRYQLSDKLELKPSVSVTYDFDVDGFSSVFFKVSASKLALILLPGDRVAVSYTTDGAIRITGSNAEGLSYYNDNFIIPGTLAYVDRIRVMALKANDFSKLAADVEQGILREVKDSLAALRQNPNVSPELLALLEADLTCYFYYETHSTLKSLYSNRKSLTEKQQVEVEAAANKVFEKVPLPEPNTLKYPLGNIIINAYYSYIYNNLDEKQKQELLAGYSEDTFGSYAKFLLAPDYIRLPKLGGTFVLLLIFKVDEFDLNKMYNYLQQHYPHSEYVALLAEKLREINLEHAKTETVNFISQPVNALSELSSLSDLKGKHLLVDLWASWCIPCRLEFASKDKVNKILESYGNVESVYISIDKEDSANEWKADVEKFRLVGYNIRAEKELLADLKEKVYQSGTLSIPRYLLISPQGELLDADLPSPSKGEQLAEALQKYLK